MYDVQKDRCIPRLTELEQVYLYNNRRASFVSHFGFGKLVGSHVCGDEQQWRLVFESIIHLSRGFIKWGCKQFIIGRIPDSVHEIGCEDDTLLNPVEPKAVGWRGSCVAEVKYQRTNQAAHARYKVRRKEGDEHIVLFFYCSSTLLHHLLNACQFIVSLFCFFFPFQVTKFKGLATAGSGCINLFLGMQEEKTDKRVPFHTHGRPSSFVYYLLSLIFCMLYRILSIVSFYWTICFSGTKSTQRNKRAEPAAEEGWKTKTRIIERGFSLSLHISIRLLFVMWAINMRVRGILT